MRHVFVVCMMAESQPGEDSECDKEEEEEVRVVKVLGARRRKRGRGRFLLSFATACMVF